VSFDVAADSYGRFMGRYSEPLAVEFAGVLDLAAGQRALDVGCGPGALTARLVEVLGVESVAAVDPSASFVEAARERFPGADVREAFAENLPFADDSFDIAAAELVVHFMPDPVAGIAEMARVTRTGGLVAACVWDFAGGNDPLSTFWAAVRSIDPAADDESELPGTREGQLVDYIERAGLSNVHGSLLTVTVRTETFEQWWTPFTLGVSPAGDHVAQLDDAGRERLRLRCKSLLPEGPIDVVAAAWCATGIKTLV
jgi:SAM-dependent methyltransferase